MDECIDHGKNYPRYANVTMKGKSQKMHRLVYCQHHDLDIEDIKGLVVRHKCDNPRCINPEHLLIGSHQDNMDDVAERGRWPYGEISLGSKLTEAQVLWAIANYIPNHKELGCGALSRKFGVNRAAMSMAIRGVTWKHLDCYRTRATGE